MPENLAGIDIRELSADELKNLLMELKEPAYRAAQLQDWLWKKAVHSFEQMSNIPKESRELFKRTFVINGIKPEKTQISKDKTLKSAFTLYDGKRIEGVLIPSNARYTACVSSQVGCSLACTFCATGKMKRERNLTAGEIFDQVVFLQQQANVQYKAPLTNIVYMGMGEPMLNYNNVLQSIEKITSPAGLNISHQRITVSTAGVAKMIKKLGDDNVKFHLAVSLHAATNEKRNLIMPINKDIPLEELSEALKYFYDKIQQRITYEYILLNEFNDSIEDARALVAFSRIIPSKINVIEYNPVEGVSFTKTNPERLHRFSTYLRDRGVIVNIRRSRGKDIDAACGQLANKLTTVTAP
jgi:23S rRNA (adenine2503-C2)-methyltransferase